MQKPEEGFVFYDSERKPDYFYQESKSFEHLLEFLNSGFIESELLRLGKGEYAPV